MTDITYSDVAAAAQHFEENSQEPTVRLVRKYLGADNNKVTELMAKWKDARKAKTESKVQVNPAISDLIIFQIEATAAQATEKADLRATAAENALNELASRVPVIDAMLVARSEELGAAHALLLQREGQLQERSREIEELRALRAREIEELRTLSAATIGEADQRAHSERAKAEALRQDLVLSNMQLKMVPTLEATLEGTRKLLKASNDELALARQSEAVANSQAEAQRERADEAASREAKLEAQLQRLHEEREKLLGIEREVRKENMHLVTNASEANARCAAQKNEIEQLRQAQHQGASVAPVPALAPQDQRSAT